MRGSLGTRNVHFAPRSRIGSDSLRGAERNHDRHSAEQRAAVEPRANDGSAPAHLRQYRRMTLLLVPGAGEIHQTTTSCKPTACRSRTAAQLKMNYISYYCSKGRPPTGDAARAAEAAHL